jgi:MATE family multidrug resistance protein
MDAPPAAARATIPADGETHLRAILRLGAPLVVNNLAYAGMIFADTVMSGHIGPEALAAVAVGSNALSLLQIIGMGMMMALSPLTAHDFGAGRDTAAGRHLQQALWIAVAMSILPVVCAIGVRSALERVGTDPLIVPTAVGYVHAMCWGVPALFACAALAYTSEGLGRTRPIMLMTVAALPCNVLLNWIFMFGHFGAPALGAVGTGVATAITMWLSLAFMLALMQRPEFARFELFSRFEWPRWQHLRRILRLGVPFTGALLAEGSLFIGATLMVSSLGATIVAAHQVALSYSSVTYMVPAAFHSATTVRVGHLLGRDLAAEARRAGIVGIALCTGVMVVSALVLFVARGAIASIYTGDPAVLELATSLLLLAALFQISDGLQLGSSGALRGYQDAHVPLVILTLSYWGVGFTLAWLLGIVRGGGAPGVWVGLIGGLTTAGVLLALRFRTISTRDRTPGLPRPRRSTA